MKKLSLLLFLVVALVAADFLEQKESISFVRKTSPATIQKASYLVVPQEKLQLPTMDPKEAELRWQRLQGWLNCPETDCLLPNSDPREKQFVLRKKILEESQWFLEHGAAPEQEKMAYRAATTLLAYPEEQVQIQGLQWLQQLPVKPETLERLQDLKNVVDPKLAQLMIVEMQRHMQTEEESKALDLVEEILFRGSVYASREVARSAGFLLYDGNRHRLEGWARELPSTSAKSRLLEESLRSYREQKGI